jgi:hypothetical protein
VSPAQPTGRRRPPPAHWHHRLRVSLTTLSPHEPVRQQLLPRLYVAGDLDHFVMPAAQAAYHARDYACPGSDGRMRSFRRLDADWLAYLAARVYRAADAQQLHPVTAERWRAVCLWARERFGQARLDQALARKPGPTYAPPQAA